MHDELFTAIPIGPMTIKNRFVRSATGEGRADKQGVLKQSIFPIYRDLAAGGVGMIITGHMYVAEKAKCSPGQTGIWDECHVAGLSQMAEACKQNDTRAVAQINHAHKPPAEFSQENLAEVRDVFVQAAVRACRAGFDGVQIHAAHGYLLSGFLTPADNQREDEYGQDADGRRRLLLEITREVRGAIGPDRALLCKLGVIDGRDNSLPIQESVQTAKALQEAGVDAIEISTTFSGEHADPVATGVESPGDEAWFREQARAIKAVLAVPLILVGGMRSAAKMRALIADGTCDCVSLCRPFIREPDLVNRMAAGRAKKAACISCNKCYSPRGFRCVFVKEK